MHKMGHWKQKNKSRRQNCSTDDKATLGSVPAHWLHWLQLQVEVTADLPTKHVQTHNTMPTPEHT